MARNCDIFFCSAVLIVFGDIRNGMIGNLFDPVVCDGDASGLASKVFDSVSIAVQCLSDMYTPTTCFVVHIAHERFFREFCRK